MGGADHEDSYRTIANLPDEWPTEEADGDGGGLESFGERKRFNATLVRLL